MTSNMKKQYVAPRSELILAAPTVLAAASGDTFGITIGDKAAPEKRYSRRWEDDDYEYEGE